MLFWSFVLAFVLSILYYLSPVHNTVQVEDKPLADTMVATFVNAHQAAKRLTYTDKAVIKKQQCESKDENGDTILGEDGKPIEEDCLDKEGNPIYIEDTSGRVITFTYKEDMQKLKSNTTSGFLSKGDTASASDSSTLAYIDPDEIKNILPGLDYTDENGDSKNKLETYNITSAFACIMGVGTDSDGDGANDTVLTFDCQGGKGGGIGDYVITYMQAPKTDKATINRNELWRSGILRRTKGSHECGVLWKTTGEKITVSVYGYKDGDIERDVLYDKGVSVPSRKKYDEKSPYILDNSRRFTVSVPSLIGLALEARDDGVALTTDMESGYLLFCITPMDDIKASFEWKCKHGYGKYKIMDGDTEVYCCTETPTTCKETE